MVLPDVNVLIFAFRKDTEFHPSCRKWLDDTVRGDAPFGVSPLALSAVVRVTTNRRSYPNTSSLDDAFGFCEDVLGQPNCRIVEPGRRHWDIFRRLTIETNTRGPDVTDAWFAALALEHGCEWITTDRGFARFPRLRWSVPE